MAKKEEVEVVEKQEEAKRKEKTHTHEKKKRPRKSKSKDKGAHRHIRKNDFRSYLAYKERFLKKFKNSHFKEAGNEGAAAPAKEGELARSDAVNEEAEKDPGKQGKAVDVSEGEIS